MTDAENDELEIIGDPPETPAVPPIPDNRLIKMVLIIIAVMIFAGLATAFIEKYAEDWSEGERMIIKIAAFVIVFTVIPAFMKKDGKAEGNLEDKNLKVNCPECGRSLKGATHAMIGDTGVCVKCKAEFVIGQTDPK